MKFALLLISTIGISYILGSISFAIIISKIFTNDDVRRHGSGNAGMTNVVRTAGVVPGIITLIGDAGKGVAAVLIGKLVLFPMIAEAAPSFVSAFFSPEYGAYICGIFCLIGHIFPLFFKFKGGKGVATSIGILFCLNWLTALLVLITFLFLFLITGIVSLGSITGAFEYPLFTLLINISDSSVVYGAFPSTLYLTILSAVIGIIVILKHKDNIVRLINGEEKPMIKRKKA